MELNQARQGKDIQNVPRKRLFEFREQDMEYRWRWMWKWMWKYANCFCMAKPVLELVMPDHLAPASQPSSSSCNGHFATVQWILHSATSPANRLESPACLTLHRPPPPWGEAWGGLLASNSNKRWQGLHHSYLPYYHQSYRVHTIWLIYF